MMERELEPRRVRQHKRRRRRQLQHGDRRVNGKPRGEQGDIDAVQSRDIMQAVDLTHNEQRGSTSATRRGRTHKVEIDDRERREHGKGNQNEPRIGHGVGYRQAVLQCRVSYGQLLWTGGTYPYDEQASELHTRSPHIHTDRVESSPATRCPDTAAPSPGAPRTHTAHTASAPSSTRRRHAP